MKFKSKLLLALLATSSAAFAQTAPAAPESTLGYNVGVMSEYRYRGLGQTRGDAALQGGVDYAHSSGFYVGAWASNIKWIKDNATPTGKSKGSVELDLYAGYKFEAAGLAYDVGYLRYEYLGNKLADADWNGKGTTYKNANTQEVYGAVTAGVVTAKYSYALSDLFGNYDFTNDKSSKGSYYLDLSANFDLGNGYSFVPHAGRQKVSRITDASYTDVALTLNKDFGEGIVASVSAITTNANKGPYTINPNGGGNGVNYYQGKSALVAGLKYSF